VLVNQLSKHADLAVQAGQMYGRMRFFSSQCCGEPTEFDLQDASAYCSRCHQPVLFNKTT
jgi:NADH pyrophosphatase NudC (nudix superfamily)